MIRRIWLILKTILFRILQRQVYPVSAFFLIASLVRSESGLSTSHLLYLVISAVYNLRHSFHLEKSSSAAETVSLVPDLFRDNPVVVIEQRLFVDASQLKSLFYIAKPKTTFFMPIHLDIPHPAVTALRKKINSSTDSRLPLIVEPKAVETAAQSKSKLIVLLWILLNSYSILNFYHRRASCIPNAVPFYLCSCNSCIFED